MKKEIEIIEQCRCEEAIYGYYPEGNEDNNMVRVNFKRWYLDDEEPYYWGEWCVDVTDIDPLPDIINGEYIDFLKLCFEDLKKTRK